MNSFKKADDDEIYIYLSDRVLFILNGFLHLAMNNPHTFTYYKKSSDDY